MDKVSIYFRQIIVPSLLWCGFRLCYGVGGPLKKKKKNRHRLNGCLQVYKKKQKTIRSQFDSKKGTDKRGSLVLENLQISIVGRVFRLTSNKIDYFGYSHQLHFSYD